MEKSICLVAFQYLPFARPLLVRFCFAFDRDHCDDILGLALEDNNPMVRYEAIQSIMRNEHLSAIEPVAHTLKDPDNKVKQAAVNSLVHFGTPRCVDALYNVLRYFNPAMRVEAIRALQIHPKLKYREEIQRQVLDLTPGIQQAALETLLSFHCSEQFVPKLLDLALNNSKLRKQAFENIRRAERLPVALIPRLEKACQDNNSPDFHLEIVKVIAAYPPGKQMQTALLQFLRHISIDVRRTVFWALGEKGDREAIYHLSEVVREGGKPNNLLNQYDARMAELAIQKISSRHPLPDRR